jgi:putative transposase
VASFTRSLSIDEPPTKPKATKHLPETVVLFARFNLANYNIKAYDRSMPSKNTVKFYDANTYYHIYNRGVDKRTIFVDEQDYAVFAHLLKRYLGTEPETDSSGREYVRLTDDIQLVAFCLMPSHFHLHVYQIEPEAITALMRAVATSYVRYFNKKYGRVGGLFQGIYKAKEIDSDEYMRHITRYIHLNPGDYLSWNWSSLNSYLGYVAMDWIHPELMLDFGDPEKYLRFLADHKDYKEHLEEVEARLADS